MCAVLVLVLVALDDKFFYSTWVSYGLTAPSIAESMCSVSYVFPGNSPYRVARDDKYYKVHRISHNITAPSFEMARKCLRCQLCVSVHSSSR